MFHTTALLVYQLRQMVDSRPLTPALLSRQQQFEGFSGGFLRLSELEPAINRHGGLAGVSLSVRSRKGRGRGGGRGGGGGGRGGGREGGRSGYERARGAGMRWLY